MTPIRTRSYQTVINLSTVRMESVDRVISALCLLLRLKSNESVNSFHRMVGVVLVRLIATGSSVLLPCTFNGIAVILFECSSDSYRMGYTPQGAAAAAAAAAVVVVVVVVVCR